MHGYFRIHYPSKLIPKEIIHLTILFIDAHFFLVQISGNYCLKLIQHPNFISNRSPFYQVHSRRCVMPLFLQKRIQFSIPFYDDELIQLHHNHDDENNGQQQQEYKMGLHLSIFNLATQQLQELNTPQFDVCINNRKINMDNKITTPLDITSEAWTWMDFEITSHSPSDCVLTVEMVKIFSINAMVDRVVLYQRVATHSRECLICGQTNNLLRCSVCKSARYCCKRHQETDWPSHQLICNQLKKRGKFNLIPFKSMIDIETNVSLTCPLSGYRIVTPIRGAQCVHPQCIDLATFLAYSYEMGVWECPVCLGPLDFDQIVIDYEMWDILTESDYDSDMAWIRPDGSFKCVQPPFIGPLCYQPKHDSHETLFKLQCCVLILCLIVIYYCF